MHKNPPHTPNTPRRSTFNLPVLLGCLFLLFGAHHVLAQDILLQAEDYDAMQGVYRTSTHIEWVSNGDWVRFDNVNFGAGYTELTSRVAVPPNNAGQHMEVRLGSITGPLIGTMTIASTGGWWVFAEQSIPLAPVPTGVHTVYMVFVGSGNSLGNFDWFKFGSPVAQAPAAPIRLQAEDYDAMQGVHRTATHIEWVSNGDWVRFDNVDFGSGYTQLNTRLAVPLSNSGRQMEVRLGSSTGTLIGTMTIASTGGWGIFAEQNILLSSVPAGTHTVYILFVGSGNVGNFDWFEFHSPLVAPPASPIRLQAEDYDAMQGVYRTATHIEWVSGGDWVRFDHVDFGTGYTELTTRLAVPANNAGRQMEVRLGSTTGALIGTMTIAPTGGWGIFAEQSIPLEPVPSGVHTVYFAFVGSGNVGNFDWFEFGSPLAVETPLSPPDPISLQAEQYDAHFGVTRNGAHIESCDDGDWIAFYDVDFGSHGFSTLTAFLAVPASKAGNGVELRLGSPTGRLIGTLIVQSTGGYYIFQEQSVTTLLSVSGVHDLYVVFRGASGICNLNWISLSGDFGATVPAGEENTYFVSPQGSNVTGNGTRALPWKLPSYAAKKAFAGIAIHLLPGNYDETTSIRLNPGVDLRGEGIDVSTVTFTSPAACVIASTALTAQGLIDGNQKIHDVTINGNNNTMTIGIAIAGRNNVEVYNVKILEFDVYGITCISAGNQATGSTPPPHWVTGLHIHNCVIVHNQTKTCVGGMGLGHQLGARIHDNHITVNRGAGIAAANSGWLRQTHIYNNTVNTFGVQDGYQNEFFAIEIPAIMEDTLVYGNVTNNGISLVNGKGKGNGTWALHLFDNTVIMRNGGNYAGAILGLELGGPDMLVSENFVAYADYPISIGYGNAYNQVVHSNVFLGRSNSYGSIFNPNVHIFNNVFDANPGSTADLLHIKVNNYYPNLHSLKIQNNIFMNAGGGIAADSGTYANVLITNNCFHNLATSIRDPGNRFAGALIQNNFTANPQLTGGTATVPFPYYAPASINSFVVDKGADVGLSYIGSAIDIGAYEYGE